MAGKRDASLRVRASRVTAARRLLDRLDQAIVNDTDAKALRVECGQTGNERFRYETDLREETRSGCKPTMTIEDAGYEAAEVRQSCRAGVDPRNGAA